MQIQEVTPEQCWMWPKEKEYPPKTKKELYGPLWVRVKGQSAKSAELTGPSCLPCALGSWEPLTADSRNNPRTICP